MNTGKRNPYSWLTRGTPTPGVNNHFLRTHLFRVFWFLFFIVTLFFFFWWSEPLRRTVPHLKPLALAFGFILSFCGLGLPLVRWMVPKKEKEIQFLSAVAIGTGLTWILVLVTGLLGYLQPYVFLAWTILGLILFAVGLLQCFPLRFNVRVQNIWDLIGIATIVVVILSGIPYFISPEVSNDALAYHLLVPKLYMSLGKISHVPLLVESNYPPVAEYNYLLVLLLSNEIVCKGLHFFFGILVSLTIAAFVKMLKPGTGTFLAPAFFLSMPVVVVQLGWSWNDFFYTFFVLLCILHLVSYQKAKPEERNVKVLALAGIMAGLAASTKYTFVLFFPVLCLMLLICIRKWGWRQKSILWVLLPVVFLSATWMLKNWIYTGNPFYPFLNTIFQSPYWTLSSNHYYEQAIKRFYIQDWEWYTYFLFSIHDDSETASG